MFKPQKEDLLRIINMMRKQGSDSQSTFDSHHFIDLYRAEYEHDYILMLVDNMSSSTPNESFKNTNAQIGKSLAQNSDYLGIEKMEKSESKNDHGKNTANQLWRIIPMLLMFFIMSISTLHLHAQPEFDMPKYNYVTKYVADSAYINKQIKHLDNISLCLKEKKKISDDDEIYRKLVAVRSTENSSFKLYGITFRTLSKKKFRDIMINDIEIIKSNYLQKKEYNSDYNKSIPFIVYSPSGKDYEDTIPVVSIIEAEEISLSDNDQWQMVYNQDTNSLIDSYNWAITADDYWGIDMEAKTYHYPIEITYMVHPQHPDNAFVNHKGARLMFDREGNFLRLIVDVDDMSYEIDSLKNWVCLKDFKANKYNIQSEDPLTVKYVEMILTGDIEKIQSEYTARVLGSALVGAVASDLAYTSKQKKQIDSNLKKKMLEDYSDIMNRFDLEKLKRARDYVDQLKSDHDGEFRYGRRKRIDATSYYLSLVNENGKCTHLLKIEYKQVTPFKTRKNCSIVR